MLLECPSAQPGIPSRWVEVDCITAADVAGAQAMLAAPLNRGEQVSDRVASVLVHLSAHCPTANPSDLWQHVIYRYLLRSGWSDQRWKRVSGFALERALVSVFAPRLLPNGLRLRILPAAEANALLAKLQLIGTKATKVDVFVEGLRNGEWLVFGAAHVKSSIAERIQDDVPASLAFKNRGLLSIALTIDAKSYPPPHGNCVNYGELGARTIGVDKERLKRDYIKVSGQFDALFSFNRRTPESYGKTASGKRIYSLGLHDPYPDALTTFLITAWQNHPNSIAP